MTLFPKSFLPHQLRSIKVGTKLKIPNESCCIQKNNFQKSNKKIEIVYWQKKSSQISDNDIFCSNNTVVVYRCDRSFSIWPVTSWPQQATKWIESGSQKLNTLSSSIAVRTIAIYSCKNNCYYVCKDRKLNLSRLKKKRLSLQATIVYYPAKEV